MSIVRVVISKITAVLLILCTVALLVFFGAYTFAPEATASFVSGLPSFFGGILEALTFSEPESALAIGTVFEKIGIPSYSFSLLDGEVPILSVNLVAIILFVVLLIVSNFFKPLSLITTLTVDIVGGITALGIIEGYERVVAGGGSSWSAASSCFFPMFILLAVLLFSGCDQWVDVLAGFDERRHISEYFSYSAGFLFVSAVIAFALTAIAWLLMGLGWAGLVFVAFFLICVLSIIMESITLFRVSYI